MKISTKYDGKPRRVFSKICKACGIEFFVPRHVINRRKCCSVKCRDDMQRTGTMVKCDYCGEKHYRSKSEIREFMFLRYSFIKI